MAIDKDFTCEQAFNFADDIIYKKTGEHLNTNEKQIFEAAWNDNKYSEMVDNYNLEEDTFRKYGSRLWKKLTNALGDGDKINKKNFKARLEMRYKQELLETNSINDFLVGYTASRQNQVIKNLELELEYPNGQVPLNSAFYIERDIEERCYQEILQPGALIKIKASKQTGKTSLISRILNNAAQNNYKTLRIDFETTDEDFFACINKFLRWFYLIVSKGLEINTHFEKWDKYNEFYGSNECCTMHFEENLLQHIDAPIVIALDEVHKLFQYPKIYKQFFPLLRSWHEEAKNSDIWKKLRFVVAYSTEAYIELSSNQSPFNVGFPVYLPDFNESQIKKLVEIHKLDLTDTQLTQINTILGGHPYLSRLALYTLKSKKETVDSFLLKAATEGGIYADHLVSHLKNIQSDSKLSSSFIKVISSDVPVQLEPVELLKLQQMGLVLVNGDKVMPRCKLYCDYFCTRIKM